MPKVLIALIAVLAAWFGQGLAAQAGSAERIFTLSGPDGAHTYGALAIDENGTVYGAAYSSTESNQALVYALRQGRDGTWRRNVIFEFARPGGHTVFSGLTYDQRTHALYGIVSVKTGPDRAQSVFKLAKPAGGSSEWRVEITPPFNSKHLTNEAVAVAQSGKVYGLSKTGESAVFEMTPPADGETGWTYRVVHKFDCVRDGCYAEGALAVDDDGSVFGTLRRLGGGGCGGVFQLTPPAAPERKWGSRIIHAFKGAPDGCLPSGVTLGQDGRLYGGTKIGVMDRFDTPGSIYRLSRPAGPGGDWTFERLNRNQDGFGYYANLAIGPDGSLYGPTKKNFSGGGYQARIFRLSPPARPSGAWTLKRLAPLPFSGDHYVPLSVAEDATMFGVATIGTDDQQPCPSCSYVYLVK